MEIIQLNFSSSVKLTDYFKLLVTFSA